MVVVGLGCFGESKTRLHRSANRFAGCNRRPGDNQLRGEGTEIV